MQKRRPSYYNFIHKFQDGRTLIWNTYTGSIFLIDVNEFREFEMQSGEWFEENRHYFIDSGVLVDSIGQSEQLNYIIDKRKNAVTENKTIAYTILPTTACNARCPYCFEKNNTTITMTSEFLEKIVTFIVQESTSFESIYITWFGGEPLLFKDRITTIIEQLRLNCKDKEICCDIITNGVLFDEETAQQAAKEWFVKNVQISLDGTEKNYERIKNYINIQNAYQIVLNNIQHLIDNNITVSIRLNIDKANMKDMIALIDELHDRFGKQIQVYPYPIFETTTNKNGLILKNELPQYFSELFEKLKRTGYREKICEFKEFIPWYCASTLPHNFVIMPNGQLLKCQSEIGQNLYLGNVEQGVTDLLRNNEYSSINIDDDCIRCCYLPICQGGCLASTKCASKIERCCLEKYYLHDLIEKYYLEEIEE